MQGIECSFNPKFILITEPCLSYCVEPLRKRFSDSKIFCVRYSHLFDKKNNLFDYVFYCDETKDFGNLLYNYFGEEGLSYCLFISWKAGEDVFTEEYTKCWQGIKNAVIKGRNVITTRKYFSLRWAKNSIKFLSNVNRVCTINKIDSPILICASGPSLQSSLTKIKEHRNSFFLICVSSALNPLLKNEIIPDLCISTDGGYYAKEHLKPLLKNKIPLALPLEANIPTKILRENTIVPLVYGDGLFEEILKSNNIQTIKAERNGTVSGTSAILAQALTDNKIFFCGLDLEESKGFNHTQPNILELNDSLNDYKLKTKETRLTPASFKSQALEIYRQWFSNRNFDSQIYRLSCYYKYNNNLGDIKDINWDEALKIISQNKQHLIEEKDCFTSVNKVNTEKILQEIKNYIDKNYNSIEFLKNLIPLGSIEYEKYKNTVKENEVLKKMNENKIKAISSLLKLIKTS